MGNVQESAKSFLAQAGELSSAELLAAIAHLSFLLPANAADEDPATVSLSEFRNAVVAVGADIETINTQEQGLPSDVVGLPDDADVELDSFLSAIIYGAVERGYQDIYAVPKDDEQEDYDQYTVAFFPSEEAKQYIADALDERSEEEADILRATKSGENS